MKKFWLFLGLAVVLPSLAWAQDVNLSNSRQLVGVIDPSDQTIAGGKAGVGAPTTFGATRNVTWFAASKFTVILTAGSPTLTYSGNHFYRAPGATGARYFAQLDLDPGVLVDDITPVFNDNSASNDMYFALQKYVTDISAGTSTSSTLGSASTSGTPGVGFLNIPIPNETIVNLSGFATLTNYYLVADVSTDTSFAGVYVGWKRQVSPAPASATFNDVPTSSPQFKFVEAVVAAGITAGCGGSNYCPNDPVTRGQMAVFLSVALGLEFPR